MTGLIAAVNLSRARLKVDVYEHHTWQNTKMEPDEDWRHKDIQLVMGFQPTLRAPDKLIEKRLQMSSKLLFLLGGNAVFEVMSGEFISASGGCESRIALLLQGGEQWEKYIPQYTQAWIEKGSAHFDVISPNENGLLDLDVISEQLRKATGIFIGGGYTPTYQQLYAVEPIRSLIRERYQMGVPIAGMSAGALIALKYCVYTSETIEDQEIKIVLGLGLLDDLVIGVHFNKFEPLKKIVSAMSKTQIQTGLGIEETACAVFVNNKFAGIIGKRLFKIEMKDYGTQEYSITESTVMYSVSRYQ